MFVFFFCSLKLRFLQFTWKWKNCSSDLQELQAVRHPMIHISTMLIVYKLCQRFSWRASRLILFNHHISNNSYKQIFHCHICYKINTSLLTNIYVRLRLTSQIIVWIIKYWKPEQSFYRQSEYPRAIKSVQKIQFIFDLQQSTLVIIVSSLESY